VSELALIVILKVLMLWNGGFPIDDQFNFIFDCSAPLETRWGPKHGVGSMVLKIPIKGDKKNEWVYRMGKKQTVCQDLQDLFQFKKEKKSD